MKTILIALFVLLTAVSASAFSYSELVCGADGNCVYCTTTCVNGHCTTFCN